MKFLQINTDRGREAHDLMIKTARDNRIDVCLIAEPNKSITEEWYGHVNAKILVLSNNFYVEDKGMGDGHTWFDMGKVRIVSCYISPNCSIDELSHILDEISYTIRGRGIKEIIIGGDFNAKSWGWGEHRQDRRGVVVSEWIEAENLVIFNNGEVPTFRRGTQNSIIDLTLGSEGIASKLRNWEVLDDVETLSLHQYIQLEISEDGPGQENTQSQVFKGWRVQTLDGDKFRQIMRDAVITNETNLVENIISACDSTMKKRGTNKRKEVFWWNASIKELREKCIKTRRKLTRCRRRQAGSDECKALEDSYRSIRSNLKQEIKNAKSKCWKDLCAELEKDLWGNAFQIATKKFGRKLPNLPPETRKEAIDNLFPSHPKITWQRRVLREEEIEEISLGELVEAVTGLAINKAPGPDRIPTKIIREVVMEIPEKILNVFNSLLKEGVFPAIWKEANVILLEKPTKTAGSRQTYRPICLINTLGKLLESILNNRLKVQIEEKKLISSNQYGFRSGRCTIDAIKRVVDTAMPEISKRGDCRNRNICLVVTLDIKNAFNSASWVLLVKSLEDKGFPLYLIRMIESYLSNRNITGEIFAKEMTAGVPQGSVLGGTLWNILYDGVLRLELPAGVQLVAYADDLAVIALAKNETELELKANHTLEEIKCWMELNKLEVAPDKSEAILITGKKKYGNIKILWDGVEIIQKENVKYLGITLDKKLSFLPHLENVSIKAEKSVAALARITPNIGGPGENKRRILQTVADSIVLYAAPIWAGCLKYKNVRRGLLMKQRKFSLRVCSAYRTVSMEAANVMARVIPIDLQIEERAKCYGKPKEVKAAMREETLNAWQRSWESGSKGEWTRTLIRNLIPWYSRKHGEMDFRLTQMFSGHGCFQAYLYRIGKIETPVCLFCDEIDDPEHTLFACPKWNEKRNLVNEQLKARISKENLVEIMLEDEKKWEVIKKMANEIMKEKEDFERMLKEAQRRNDTHGGVT